MQEEINQEVSSLSPVDEEDLTRSYNDNGRSVTKFADRSYSPQNFSGKGYKILRKNIKPVSLAVTKIVVSSVPTSDGYISFIINGIESHVDVVASTDTTTDKVADKIAAKLSETMTEYEVSKDASTISLTRKFGGEVSTPSSFSAVNTGASCSITDSVKKDTRNILSSNMMNLPNTIYEIRYDFDLNGEIISVPENSVLSFVGGSLKNGKIVFNNTFIKGKDVIFDIDTLQLSGKVSGKLYTSQFGYYPEVKKDLSPLIKMVAANGYTLQFDKGQYYISETYIQKSDGFSLLGANKIGYNTATIISPLDYKKSYHYLLKLGGMKDFTKPSNYEDYSVQNFTIDGINFRTWGYIGFNNEYANIVYNSQACGCLCLDFCSFGYLNVVFGGDGEALFLANTWEIRFEQIRIYGSYINHNRSAIYFGNAFRDIAASNISALAIDYILAENLGGSLLATSSSCNAADVFINTIAYERGNALTNDRIIYKKASKETIDYIFEKKNDLKKVPLLDLRDIGITIGKISDASTETNSYIVFKEDDEEYILNNLKVISSCVTIGNFNIMNHMDFWELGVITYEPCVFVGNLCFPQIGNIPNTIETLKRIHVIQTTTNCGTVQIENYSGRIVYDYDDVIDISNKYIDSTNVRHFIPDIYTYSNSILYKIHGTTLNGIEKYIIGIHFGFGLKLRANPKQILTLYLMATWSHSFEKEIKYYKANEVIHTQVLNIYIERNKITYYEILLPDIDYDYFVIPQGITNTSTRFIYAIKCDERTTLSNTTSNRPTDAFKGLEYYDTTLNKKILWNGTTWVNLDGSSLDVKKNGTTEERPSNVEIGFIYKDTTLNKLILWEGSKWVNLDGSELS